MIGKRGSRLRRLSTLTVSAVLVLSWFAWLRPTALGGRESYVVVQGPSMQPTYHDGDLVVIREEEHYAKGDIIAFRAGGEFDDPTRIIHRIVEITPDGVFVTKGDNRDGADPWAPTSEDVIGRAVFHVPKLGGWAARAGQPEVLAALGGAAVVVGGSTRRRRRRRPMSLPPVAPGSSDPVAPRPRPTSSPPRWLRHTEPRWAAVGLAITIALALPVLLTTWSTIRAADTTTEAQRIGALDFGIDVDYRFTGAPSRVYPTGVVGTRDDGAGIQVPAEPLYTRLLDNVDLAMTFHAAGDGVDGLASEYRVDATVEMAEGWSAPLYHLDATSFEGTATQVVTINLRDVAARVAEFTELTGVAGDNYTVTISPQLAVQGTAGALPVQDDVAPDFTFIINASVIQAQPANDADGSRDIVREVRKAASYDFGVMSVSIDSARGLHGRDRARAPCRRCLLRVGALRWRRPRRVSPHRGALPLAAGRRVQRHRPARPGGHGGWDR